MTAAVAAVAQVAASAVANDDDESSLGLSADEGNAEQNGNGDGGGGEAGGSGGDGCEGGGDVSRGIAAAAAAAAATARNCNRNARRNGRRWLRRCKRRPPRLQKRAAITFLLRHHTGGSAGGQGASRAHTPRTHRVRASPKAIAHMFPLTARFAPRRRSGERRSAWLGPTRTVRVGGVRLGASQTLRGAGRQAQPQSVREGALPGCLARCEMSRIPRPCLNLDVGVLTRAQVRCCLRCTHATTRGRPPSANASAPPSCRLRSRLRA